MATEIKTLLGLGAAATSLALMACNGGGSGSGDASATGVTGASQTASATGSTSTSGASESEAGTATGSESGVATSESESGDTLKLDVGAPDGGSACGCEFAYVWVANHSEGTVSKINMETLEEEGRYLTRADKMGNPSRTSVALSGDVAVANRHGGLVKFYADLGKCQDTNGVPGIQTSTGKDDVLEWEMEECRAWYTDFPTTNQRPVAWTQGSLQPGTCDSTDEKVWTVMSTTPALFPGLGGPGGVTVSLVNGESGAIEKQVKIETFSGESFGAYGGAVDSNGNLWFTSMAFSAGKIARVNIDNFTYQVWDVPTQIGPYGITVDHKDRVWLSSAGLSNTSAGRFDPETEEWAFVSGFYSGAGLAEGRKNLMWISSHLGISSVDIDTLKPGPVFPTSEVVKGVGFDVNGFLWGVTWADEDDMGNMIGNELVLKIDPISLKIVGQYDGVNRPYTYSDFTGSALANVACTPAG